MFHPRPREEVIADALLHTPSTTSPLRGIAASDEGLDESTDLALLVVAGPDEMSTQACQQARQEDRPHLLVLATVDAAGHIRDRYAGLGNVGRDNDLSNTVRGSVEDEALILVRDRRVAITRSVSVRVPSVDRSQRKDLKRRRAEQGMAFEQVDGLADGFEGLLWMSAAKMRRARVRGSTNREEDEYGMRKVLNKVLIVDADFFEQ